VPVFVLIYTNALSVKIYLMRVTCSTECPQELRSRFLAMMCLFRPVVAQVLLRHAVRRCRLTDKIYFRYFHDDPTTDAAAPDKFIPASLLPRHRLLP
jgi:hypothetical protein